MLPRSWKFEYIVRTSFLIHLALWQKWWACNLILFLSQLWRGTSRGLDRGTKFVVLNTSVVWPCILQVHGSSNELYTLATHLHHAELTVWIGLIALILKVLLCLWFAFPVIGITTAEMEAKKQGRTSHMTNLSILSNTAILLVANISLFAKVQFPL